MPAIVIFDVSTQKYRRSIPLEPGLSLRSISWADEETVLVTVSTLLTNGSSRAADHYEIFRTFAADVEGGKSRMLLMRDGTRGFVTGSDLLATRTGKPKTVMMATLDYSGSPSGAVTGSRLPGGGRNSGWFYSLYEVDTRTGAARLTESGNGFTEGWVIDPRGAAVARIDWNPKKEQFSILAKDGDSWRESPSSPPVYYLVDLAANKADIVGEAYPALADAKLGEVRMITYKARDGADVPAYLTLPPGSSGKNLPLILLPHGGPESRDNYEFDWLTQFLATRGYAVLQPQFRGSTGFGDAWRKAGYRQWGLLMQDDITDGVKALIEQGVADSKRVCVVGWSYGGYAALAGAAFTPDLYRCAVSINGVSDLPQMLSYELARASDGDESSSVAYGREHIGPVTDRAVIEKSPARAATQVKAPVLLLTATNDTVVPSLQSEMMARALKILDKPVTLVQVKGDDHWLSQTATRLQVLKETEKFLKANLQ